MRWDSNPGALDFGAHALTPIPDAQVYVGPGGHRRTKRTEFLPPESSGRQESYNLALTS